MEIIIGLVIGLLLGVAIAYFIFGSKAKEQDLSQQAEAEKLLAEATLKAEKIQADAELKAERL